ncbi:MAG: sulfatase [Kiritimatiellia bacterium]
MRKPNVVFILIDDMGWRDIACYGSKFYESPNIDKLFGEGMHFSDGYAACPVCSPTRAAIMTGKYPARLKLTNYIDWTKHGHPLRGRVIDAPYIDCIPGNEQTLAHAFGGAGYATWHLGKWHLGYPDAYPENRGFDINIGGNQWGMPCKGYFAPWHLPNLSGKDVPENTHLDDYLTDRAIELIRGAGGRPFFLNLWYYSVHTPVEAKPDDVAHFEKKAREMGLDTGGNMEEREFYPYEGSRHKRVAHRRIQSNPAYAGMVLNLDRNVGRVLSALDEAGVRDNTIVVFTSDNGGLSTGNNPPTSNGPLANGKGWMQEGGTREPLVFRYPGAVKPGTSCSEPVTSVDFYPTLLELAGLDPIPDQHVDGKSIVPALSEKPFERGPVYWHYPHYSNCGGYPGCSVRAGDFKLTRFFEDGSEVLHNLREDIGEQRDLSGELPEKRGELSGMLTAWQKETGALLPSHNTEWKEEDHEDGTAPTV